MSIIKPLNLKKWIEENRHLLKPPVGNKAVYKDSASFIMIVGGPNLRKDYHVNVHEELFYQIEGDIELKIIEEGKMVTIPILEGDMFLLPPHIPHSPQRGANTVGLVIERKRALGELDGLKWFCESCVNVLYEETVQLTKVEDLPPIFKRFNSNPEYHRCKKCGWEMEMGDEKVGLVFAED
ncbi:MAG: 3-hydroxyanthranilate 3,4-dioxygenase [Chlamydiae bacterium]|nr:3-hydroxyanthranilate 3,4-dioxygenase [Chlamydiota bacterium]